MRNDYVESVRPACALLVVGDTKSQPLLRRGADAVGETAHLWTGVALDSQVVSGADAPLPAKPAIVFTTLDSWKTIATGWARSHHELAQMAALDEQGFVCVPLKNNGAKQAA